MDQLWKVYFGFICFEILLEEIIIFVTLLNFFKLIFKKN